MNVKITESQKIKVLNSVDVYSIMQQILLRENQIRRNREHFWVIGLNNANKILFIELISLGAVNRVQVDPPEVFRMAIYKMAVRMILVHNHPGGQTIASQADMDMTDRMIKVGEIVKIEVIDHLIITETTYIGFEALGLMDKLRNSDSYRVLDRLETEMKAMQIEAAEKKAKKDQASLMAKKMLSKGKYSIEEISELTGLTKKQVEKLGRG